MRRADAIAFDDVPDSDPQMLIVLEGTHNRPKVFGIGCQVMEHLLIELELGKTRSFQAINQAIDHSGIPFEDLTEIGAG